MTMKIGDAEGSQKEEKTLTNEEVTNAKLLELSSEIERLKKQQAPTVQAQFGATEISAIVEAAVSAALKGARKEKNYESGIEEAEIPLEDFDETGVTFYSPSVGYFLTDDRRKGQIVVAPYNRKIFFEHVATRRQGSGKHETTAPISKYISHSKTITKWIEEHTLYGTMFYKSSSGISHDAAMQARRTAQIMTAVKNYETPDLIRRCNEYNVPLSSSYDQMRYLLAIAMAEREIQISAEHSQRILNETYKSNVALGRVKGV